MIKDTSSIRFKYDDKVDSSEINNQNELKELKGHLLGSYLRVDKDIVPEISKIIDEVKQNITIQEKIEAFIYPGSTPQAGCYPGNTDKEINIALSSNLVENLNKEELLYVIGHEIGHHIFRHNTKLKEEQQDLKIGDLFSLQCQEISADRVGFLASNDISTVASAMVKVMSGLSSKFLTTNFLPMIRQIDEVNISGYASTHPFFSLRLKSLSMFSMSDSFYKFKEIKKKATFTKDELDDEIVKRIKKNLFPPEFIEEEKKLFLIFVNIFLADNKVTKQEQNILRKLFPDELVNEFLNKIKTKQRDVKGFYHDFFVNQLLALKQKNYERFNEIKAQSITYIRDLPVPESDKKTVRDILNEI